MCQRFCCACLCISSTSSSNRHVWAGANCRSGAGDWGPTDSYLFKSCPVGLGAQAGNSGGNGNNAHSEQVVSTLAGSGGGGGGGATSTYVCYIGFSQDHFTFVFGSGISNWPCSCITHLGGAAGAVSCYNLGYVRDDTFLSNVEDSAVIPLSTLKSETGGNLTDFKFGNGASVAAPGYGGGGNRLNTAGGGGAVVIVY